MKIQPLIVIAIVGSTFLPQTYGQINAVAADNQLLATAVISQDAPTEDKVEAAAEELDNFGRILEVTKILITWEKYSYY